MFKDINNNRNKNFIVITLDNKNYLNLFIKVTTLDKISIYI